MQGHIKNIPLYQMAKMTRISKIFLLLLMYLCFTAETGAGQQQRDTLMLAPGSPGMDTLMVDTLVVDTLMMDTIEELHPLIWEHVKQGEKIAWLLQAHRHAVSQQPGMQGYRVHLYMDSGNRARLNTQNEKADFQKKYPDVDAYIVYDEPYFKLRAGDFRTRVDARRFLEKIRSDYSAAYIVVDRVNPPELD